MQGKRPERVGVNAGAEFAEKRDGNTEITEGGTQRSQREEQSRAEKRGGVKTG